MIEPKERKARKYPAHYTPLHIAFSDKHLRRIKANKAAMIPVESLHEDGSRGGRLTYLSTAQALAAQKALLGHTKNFKYHPSLADIKFNTEQGGSWSDFSEWLGDRWEDAKSIGKTILAYAPGVLDFVSDILPASSAQLIALKAALKTASQITGKLNDLVNKTSRARDSAEQAQTEYETAKDNAESAALDFKLAGKDKDISDKAKAKLKKEAEEAREKLAKKKAEAKKRADEALRLEKEAKAALSAKKAADAAAEVKARAAEAAAKKLQADKAKAKKK